MVITVRRIEGNPTEAQSAEAAAVAVDEMKDILAKVEAQHSGRTSTEHFDMPEGVQPFAARVNPVSFAGAKYFLLYGAVASKGHLALLTIEGPGEAGQMAGKYDAFLKAVRFAT